MQDAVFAYAKTKGEYDARLADITELYKDVEDADINGELTADLVGDYLFTDEKFVRQLFQQNRNVFERMWNEIKYLCKTVTAGTKEAKQLLEVQKTFEKVWNEGKSITDENVRYSLVGVDENNIEVYETSEDVKKLPYSERKKKLLEFMKKEYAGRTAKFIKNGQVYYAQYDESGVNKGVYGDNKSSNRGYKAKINIGADGNYIELAENALYQNSKPETGKENRFHKDAKMWDYFVKTIKSDGNYFDVVINVKDTGIGQYVYDITLKEAASLPDSQGSYDGSSTASTDSISQNSQNATENAKKSLSNNNQDIAPPVGWSTKGRDINSDVKTAENYFGTTYNISEAGYLLIDGKFLDFSGRHEGGPGGYRGVDHRDITDAFDGNYGDDTYSGAMIQFMKAGNIRLSPESGGINISTKPNKAQISSLDRYISKFRGEVILDIDDTQGNTIVSIEYPKHTYSKRIINDINAYFDNGTMPEKPSELGQFRYSLSNKTKDIAPPIGWDVKGSDIAFDDDFPIRSDISPKTAAGVSGPVRTDAVDVEADYAKAEDKKLYQYIIDALSGKLPKKSFYKISEKISNRLANDIEKIVGFSVKDYGNEITANYIRHIDSRHGKSGKADHSMQNISDVAKIGYVIENYDDIRLAKKSGGFRNRDGSFAKTVELQKKIGDHYYYVVEAVPDTELKTLQVVSAYINKNDTFSEVGNAKSPNPDVRNAAQSNVSSNIIIPDAQKNASDVVGEESGIEDMATDVDEDIDDDMSAEEIVNEKVAHLQNEVDMNRTLREQAAAAAQEKIAGYQAEYDAKKKKDTKEANKILRKIERAKRLAADDDSEYANRIKNLETRIEKMKANPDTVVRAEQRKIKNEQYSSLWERLVGDTSTWVDKKFGISYKTNTLRRNLRDIVRDADGKRDIAKADAIYDELQGNYNRNEASLNRESNKIKEPYKALKITKEEDAYIQMLGELRHNPDSELTEKKVKAFYERNKGKIDVAKVDKIIEDARATYDELFNRVNAVLREQGMKEIPYRKGYFPHFKEEQSGFLGKLLNWKKVNNDIPTSIAGITETFKPNRSWQSFNKQRLSDDTDYSFTKGLDTYVHGALDWIYHIEDIQKRRALENYIRYTHSEEGVQDRIKEIRGDSLLTYDEAQAAIDQVLSESSNPLNNFVTDLRAGTNTLAGKKSSMDRTIEEAFNREFYSTMTNLYSRVTANQVAGSISSALTNFIPITQSWGQVSPKRSLQAMRDTIGAAFVDDGIVKKSDFLTNRLRKEEKLFKSNWDKVSEKATFGTNATKLLSHFMIYGIKEGRQAKSTFNVRVYKDSHADLQRAFGNDMNAYVQHYLTYGYKEASRKTV